jgi:Glyoxalase/Bleomycin resistance protein/Dioxygenase superfamily
MTGTIPHVEVVQNAYVVPDLAEGAQRFHELYGTGPFLVGRGIEMREAVYRGKPVTEPIIIDVALAQAGEISLELITQVSGAPSAFRDMFPDGGPGLHHVATWARDWEAERQAYLDAGLEIAMESLGRGDYTISFIDARPALGHMIELYPDHQDLRRLYGRIRDLATTWDGRELLLPL